MSNKAIREILKKATEGVTIPEFWFDQAEQAITAEILRAKAEAYRDVGSKGGKAEVVRTYAKNMAVLTEAEIESQQTSKSVYIENPMSTKTVTPLTQEQQNWIND